MSEPTFYMLVGAALFGMGLYAMITKAHLLRKIIALNIMSSGIFLVLISIAYANASPVPDPVPHAMVLTGIVVSVSATAFALALARRIYADIGEPYLPEDKPQRELP